MLKVGLVVLVIGAQIAKNEPKRETGHVLVRLEVVPDLLVRAHDGLDEVSVSISVLFMESIDYLLLSIGYSLDNVQVSRLIHTQRLLHAVHLKVSLSIFLPVSLELSHVRHNLLPAALSFKLAHCYTIAPLGAINNKGRV